MAYNGQCVQWEKRHTKRGVLIKTAGQMYRGLQRNGRALKHAHSETAHEKYTHIQWRTMGNARSGGKNPTKRGVLVKTACQMYTGCNGKALKRDH